MKKMFLCPIIIAAISFSAHANIITNEPSFAIGTYIPTAPGTNPWGLAIIFHHNEDSSWISVPIPWENHPVATGINGIYCDEQNCIATTYNTVLSGNHYDQSKPFFLMSNNHGKSWYINKNIVGLPDMNGGYTANIHCKNNTCFAIGHYEDSGAFNFSLFLRSFDKGHSWSYTAMPFPASRSYKGNSLSALTCFDKTCLISGSYYNNEEKKENIFFRSENEGLDWSSTQKISGMPNNEGISVGSIKCNTNVCIAAGSYAVYYDKNWEMKHDKPLLLITYDKGISWKFINNINFPEIAYLKLNSFIFSNGRFFLIGGYSSVDNSFKYKGFILLSKDEGHTWTFINKVDGIEENKLTALKSISCIKNICITGGDNDAGLNFLISPDSGSTWKKITNIKGMKQIPNIEVIQGRDNQFTVLGSLGEKDEEGDISSNPVSLLSSDNGESWEVQNSFKNVPIASKNLHFKGIK